MEDAPELALCGGCAAYVHHLLQTCPMCGAGQQARTLWLDSPEHEPLAELPTSFEEMRSWLLDRHDADTADAAVQTIRTATDETPSDIPRAIQAYCAGNQADGASPAWDGWLAERSVRGFEPSAHLMLSRLKYRYLGGLTGHPAQLDVRASASSGYLVVTDAASARELIRVSAARVLATSAFIEEVPVLRSSIGIAFENVITFSTPTTKGGGLLVLFSTGLAAGSFAIGNRSGLFASGGKPDYYFGMVEILAGWLHSASRAREAQIGTAAYAEELGLATPPDVGPRAEVDPASRLSRLEDLLDAGLITQEEYAAKRHSILADL